MRPRLLAPGLALLAATAAAATVNDYYGKWSRGDCGEEWVMFADGKVTQFSNRFQAVETADNPSAVRKAAPAPRPAAAPPPKAPEPAKAVDAAPAAKPAATDPANPDQPRNPATARKLIDNTAPRNPATARRVTDPPAQPAQGATAAAPATPGAPKAAPKSKEMVLPATLKLDGDRLSVETQEQGRKPRREVYTMADKDTLVLQDTYVDGRRIPPITRDQITYKRCK